MSNSISFNRKPDIPSLRVSNGYTEVLWDLLRLAGRALGVPITGDGVLGWILDRDQEEYGRGCVGFDLDDMPWGDAVDATHQRAILLAVIDRAASAEDWAGLDYTPGPMAHKIIATFRALVAAYTPPTVVPEDATP